MMIRIMFALLIAVNLVCKLNAERCGHNTWDCSDGQCVSLFSRCDGYRDCKDGSDEECDVADSGYKRQRRQTEEEDDGSYNTFDLIVVIAALVVAVIMSTCGPLCCILMCYCIFRINKVCHQRNEFLASQQARSVTDTPSVLPLEQVNTMDMTDNVRVEMETMPTSAVPPPYPTMT